MRNLLRTRLLWRRLAIGLLGAALIGFTGASLLVGGFLGGARETRSVIFTASPAGSISPSGTQTLPLGSVIDVSVRATDSAWTPGLIVDQGPVVLAPQADGSYAYRLTVEADHVVQATFAELADNVRQLDKATAGVLVEMAPDETRLVFASSTPLLDGLVAGDILTNSLDDGLAEPVMVRGSTRPQNDMWIEAFWKHPKGEVLDRQRLEDLAAAEAAVQAHAGGLHLPRLHGELAWRTAAERYDGTPLSVCLDSIPLLAGAAPLLNQLIPAP